MKKKALIGLSTVIVALAIAGCYPPPTPCPACSPCPPTPNISAVKTEVSQSWIATVTAVAAEYKEEVTVPPPSVPPTVRCPDAISPEEAIAEVGEIKTVQGTVVDSYWASGSSGRPTFLNFCKPYPDHCFTALIWEDDRQQFIGCIGGEPEVVLVNREVCVRGLIELYGGKPEVILRECHQLEIIE